MAKRIEVRAGDAEDSIAVVDSLPGMTLKDAKRRAHYLASAEYARGAEMSERFRFVAVYADGEQVFQVLVPASVEAGKDYYLPYPEKVARVRVVELGTGGRNLKRVPRNPVLIAEDGGEHVVSADTLYTDELAASIRSAEMAKEIDEKP